jgi:DNA polymerase-1
MDGKTFVDEVFRIIEKEGLDISESMPPLVLKYRELSKMVSTYYNAFIERSVDRRTISGREYGILHCSFNPSEAKTGRFSCSDPNLQNQPRLLGPRECFVPRNGRHNWHFDYEQIEMRLFAHFTRDIKMAKAIEKDIHLHVASEIYGLSLEKISAEQRKRAKMVNFGIIYGAGVRTLTRNMRKKGLDVTESEVTKLLEDYHRRYPSVRKLVTRLKQELARYGFITNPFGRRYHIEKEKGYRGPNNLLQGTAADEMKQAMVRIWKELRKKGYRSRMIMTIHDEIVLEIPRNEETVVPGLVMKLMENLVQYFIPIRVDAKVSTHCWSKKTDPKKAGLQIAS